MGAEGLQIATQKAGVEQAGNAVGLNRAEAVANAGNLNLDQRLQPQQAARAVSDYLRRHARLR
jgi:hypothetical protein